ncbi:right-handed parallel beta-helix repeat-containing protein [Streptomyces sp. SID10815]|uniref:right-handed parallel beta-helix repeat-containing protein n=1 Tax=Streptomyces sp. SID10815 TaxID=2706027 RepID=UPI0013C6FAED|nr:right-handed parallel beta-helix repeat-containing protein [Streptomyces sp. SID10815]NEA45859.1 right-handed parallel beta-helix repeat-containing protein [Streptomyces sp. SID10815]
MSPRRRARTALTAAAAAALVALTAFTGAPAVALTAVPAAAADSPVTVHLDCSQPRNGTGSRSAPYNDLASVNALTFGPGDTLALAAGTTCHGTLAPKGSGTAAAPVSVVPYGTGAAPVVNADGAENALRLTDQDHWTVRAIELTDPAADVAQRQGLLIESTDGRTHSGFDIDGLIVDRVAGETDKAAHATAFAQSACIRTGASGTGSLLSDVHVHHTRVSDCGGGGIKVRTGTVNTRLGQNVHVDHNTVSAVGGDGVIVSYAESPLIEYNTAAGLGTGAYPWTGGNFAGIWVLGDHDAVIQKNVVYGSVMSAYDSEAFDCDWGNTGTCTVQYNFSRDNAGGLFLDCDGCGTVGGATEVVRYNVSQNDCRMVGAGGGRSALRFYNNVVYCPGRKLDVTVPANSLMENNVWVGREDSRLPTGAGVSWQWNVFQGVPRPTANGIVGDPLFVAPGTGGDTLGSADGYRLRAGSPALGNGGVVADNGGRDYWGAPVSATAKPNRGADDGPGL